MPDEKSIEERVAAYRAQLERDDEFRALEADPDNVDVIRRATERAEREGHRDLAIKLKVRWVDVLRKHGKLG